MTLPNFDSVEDFLRKVESAKLQQEDPDPVELEFSVPFQVSDQIEKAMIYYGDEAVKQIALYSLFLWFKIHQETMDQAIEKADHDSAMMVLRDLVRLGEAMRTVEEISSFGGAEEYENAKDMDAPMTFPDMFFDD